MIQIRKATGEDIEELTKARCRTMAEVCGLSRDYEFSAEFIKNTKEYFLNGNGTTIIAVDNSSSKLRIVGNATLCYTEMMPTFSHPGGKRPLTNTDDSGIQSSSPFIATSGTFTNPFGSFSSESCLIKKPTKENITTE